MPVVIAAMIAAAIVAAVSFGSIPDSNGIIHGCYQPVASGDLGGDLGVVDSGSQSCNGTALSWDQHGIIASGQTNNVGSSTACTWASSGITYCNPNYSGGDPVYNNDGPSTQMTFTASENGDCMVNFDGNILTGAADGAFVQFGLAEYNGSSNTVVDDTDVTSAPGPNSQANIGDYNSADIARSVVVPITQGDSYTFEPWIDPNYSNTGTFYYTEDFVCWSS